MTPTDADFDDMHHALGRPDDWGVKPYRNHYCTDAGGKQAKRFEAMPDLWRLVRLINDGRDALYAVTDAGQAAVRRWHADKLRAAGLRRYCVEVRVDGQTFSHYPVAKSPSAARYEAYVDFDDAWNFVDRFKGFLRLKPKVRLA